jgi:hypothetical protein
MEVLDGDDGVLRSKSGAAVKRDIVQFVPFRDFKSKPVSRLAAEVLREIPGQFTSYYQSVGVKPLGAQ